MADLKLRNIQLGDSATPSENVIVEVPSPNDGTFNIKRGDGTNVMNVGVDNKPDFAQGFKSQGQGISPFGRRNVVINGDCRIVQDQVSRAFPNNTSGYGGPDMFKASNIAAGGQFTQSQGSLTFNGVEKKTVRQTVDSPNTDLSGSNYWFGIYNAIEGFNGKHLEGQTTGLSFIFNSNVSGVYSVVVRTSDNIIRRSYLTSFEYVSGSPKKVEINIDTAPIGSILEDNGARVDIAVGFLNSGAFNSATAEQWQSGSFLAVPNFTNWGATAGNFIELTELQLELGQPSAFETLSFGEQLALCQRYLKSVVKGVEVGNGFLGATAYSGLNLGYLSLDIGSMRTTPSLVLQSGSITYLDSNNIPRGSPIISVKGLNTIQFAFTGVFTDTGLFVVDDTVPTVFVADARL